MQPFAPRKFELSSMEGLDHDANDVHICGVCKSQFNTLDDFIHHKASHLRYESKILKISFNHKF